MKTLSVVLFALGAIVQTAVAAPLANGDFGTGTFLGWVDTGNTDVVSCLGGPCPPSGNLKQAFLGTNGTAVYALGNGAPATAAILAGAMGVSTATLDGLTAPADNVKFGSSIRQSFTANAGSKVSFSWNFVTDESANPNGNDYALFILDGTPVRLANTFSTLGATPTAFTFETGFTTVDVTLTSSGLHDIAFGVVDVRDALGASGLLVDNVKVSPVPLPASLWLFTAAWASLGRPRRKS